MDAQKAFKLGFHSTSTGFNGEIPRPPPGYESIDEYLDRLFEKAVNED